MYTIELLADEFWQFVRGRAYSPEGYYVFSALIKLDQNRMDQADYSAEHGYPIPNNAPRWEGIGEHGPITYPTIQDAFDEFLIFLAGRGEAPSYADWVKLQAYVINQIYQNESLLKVQTPKIVTKAMGPEEKPGTYRTWSDDANENVMHTMEVAPGFWSALTQDYYHGVVQSVRALIRSSE